ncbi:N-acetylneuraminate synthase [Brevibacillus humidisoli]|uniref:N-acetylneuraminate synthase n=1 Tax=Brevibacillus humidisoli TaxID=2895522 RepID=UPI001E3F0436|nr:N-acetylneuraminate synthase [Brevibacillus humidisoli]UFJ40050.1 N-acetylneuraminate synthase [Brevibacillus humidisoli]
MQRTFIIAEAGVNHNGSLERAKDLIRVAAEAGADAVKFQTFKAEQIISRHAEKAAYQKQTTGTNESQLDMVKKLELDVSAHIQLKAYCEQYRIQFLSTPFDLESVDLLVQQIHVPTLKVPSGEITNGPLLLKMAQTDLPIILSTGMATLAEVEQALGVLAFGYTGKQSEPSIALFRSAYSSQEGQQALREKVTLLHCTTEYPCPYSEVNLRAMDTLSTAFGLPVGLSDHTEGIAVPIAAVARGARVIEKHFTLDKNLPGPDHRASLEPDELAAMITGIRQVESSLGSPVKAPSPSELRNREVVRKSLVAASGIGVGERFREDNLTYKRPGTGLSPMHYWEWLGKTANRLYQADEVIEE